MWQYGTTRRGALQAREGGVGAPLEVPAKLLRLILVEGVHLLNLQQQRREEEALELGVAFCLRRHLRRRELPQYLLQGLVIQVVARPLGSIARRSLQLLPANGTPGRGDAWWCELRRGQRARAAPARYSPELHLPAARARPPPEGDRRV